MRLLLLLPLRNVLLLLRNGLQGALVEKLLLLLVNVLLLLLLKLLLLGVKLLLHLLKPLLLRGGPMLLGQRRAGRRKQLRGNASQRHFWKYLSGRAGCSRRSILASSELTVRLATSGGDRRDGRSVLGLETTGDLHQSCFELSTLSKHRLSSLVSERSQAGVDQGGKVPTARVDLANTPLNLIDPIGQRGVHRRGS